MSIRWVRIETRLPPEGKDVLLYSRDASVPVRLGYCAEGRVRMLDGRVAHPSHWALIPTRHLARRKYWTAAEVESLRARYPSEQTDTIAADLGHSLLSTYNKAQALGLKKTPEFMRSSASGRLQGERGIACRFQKGLVPWNKGMKGLQFEGSQATQFKPGSKPANWLPIGAERYSKEGYLQRKMTDTGYPPRDWVPVHVLLWQEHNGPIPPRHRVRFSDGDKTNITIENLELISIADLMRMNTRHNLPKELNEIITLRATLTRHINKRSRHEQRRENT